MQPYRNLSRSSGVIAYEVGDRWIKIKFTSGDAYTYSYKKAGKTHVEQMKLLAEQGKGLAGYISKYVKDLFD